MIENYQSALGYYPPDNLGNRFAAPGGALYENDTGENQLLYELTGAMQLPDNPAGVHNFQGFDGSVLTSTVLNNTFGRGGIANSSQDEPHCFFNPQPKPAEYSRLPNLAIYGLTVPLPLPGNGSGANFVHYDSSSTNRHNPSSFDVWVEYDGGSTASSGSNFVKLVYGNWH
jgi:hypothetical protein